MEAVHTAAVDRIKACLADPAIRKLLVGDLNGKLVWVERKAVVMNDKGLTPAVFDRVHITPGKSALVIDYKTATGRTDDYLKEHYLKQMESYRDAVARITGIDPANIHCKLVGIQTNRLSIIDVI
jgi:ATP-dependent exoDNAse (exonuclease V) beta subunit